MNINYDIQKKDLITILINLTNLPETVIRNYLNRLKKIK